MPALHASGDSRGVRVLFFLSVLAVGCASVKPYDRGLLAKPKMQVEPNPESTKLEQHVYDYREGATGGYGSVGGGCGCN